MIDISAGRCCTPMVAEPLTTDLARGLKALGDPVRLRLLPLIAARAGGEICVCDLRVRRLLGTVLGQRRGS